LEEFKQNTNFNLFNYKNYMLSKKTYYKMSAENINLISNNKNILYNIKTYLINRIDKIKRSEYLKTFILGDSSDIDEKILTSYRTNGISHLFSVSGMHITLLSTIILYILNKIKKSKFNYLLVILFLIFYMFLTNFTPSVIRATFLFILLTINNFFNLNLSTFKILIIILCLALINNPYNIYNAGFKFSYVVSLFLILNSKLINRSKSYILKILTTSFISFLAGIPIMINNYFSINILSVLINIIFVPLISIIIFPFSLIILIFPKLDFIYGIMIDILENLSLFITNFKMEIILCKVDIFIIIFYYLIIILVLHKMHKKKYIYLILIIVTIFIHTNINYIRDNSYVTFIDVGQGDSALIHLPHNKGDILIDTGGSYNYDYSTNIISYLKSEGIKKLDYLILSHGDYDHLGSSFNLIDNFKIDNIIMNSGEINENEKRLIDKGINYYLFNKNKLSISNYDFYFLNSKDITNENDDSLVLFTKINNLNILFMGDASKKIENKIIDEYNLGKVDILKVGHHGSNTSTSDEFINIIKPKYSIISVGLNNRYHHPNSEVTDTLNKYNSNIFLTSINGSIKIDLKSRRVKCAT